MRSYFAVCMIGSMLLGSHVQATEFVCLKDVKPQPEVPVWIGGHFTLP